VQEIGDEMPCPGVAFELWDVTHTNFIPICSTGKRPHHIDWKDIEAWGHDLLAPILVPSTEKCHNDEVTVKVLHWEIMRPGAPTTFHLYTSRSVVLRMGRDEIISRQVCVRFVCGNTVN